MFQASRRLSGKKRREFQVGSHFNCLITPPLQGAAIFLLTVTPGEAHKCEEIAAKHKTLRACVIALIRAAF